MGYAHINNLYRPEAQGILMFPEVWAMEKVHGTSAHVAWSAVTGLRFYSGGEKYDNFVASFAKFGPTPEELISLAREGEAEWTVYGEAYGGRQQGMGHTYGPDLRFIAFDVQIGGRWLSVLDADAFCAGLGIEFVPYRKLSSSLPVLDLERDLPSRVAQRRGMGDDKKSEGIVIRPLMETVNDRGERIVAKHKTADFSERRTPPPVDTTKLEILKNAAAIVEEWVTEERLNHVMDHLRVGGLSLGMSDTGSVIREMVSDVYREGRGELVESKEVSQAIGKKTAQMFKQRVTQVRV